MELAFLNGIRHSLIFPPRDPWLSSYSISYYYFGYVIMAMLAELTNTASAVAFNLGIALLFALTLLGSYGMVYNLVSAVSNRRGVAVTALIAPIFTGLIGNLAGFLELIRALHFPFISASFWTWLDIEDLSDPLRHALWPPDQWRFWWWWRASRVIQDRDLAGTAIGLQPIDEFPSFSFLLGDMHPHVLALPFVLLVLALVFNMVTQKNPFSRLQLGIYTICFGGLAFLNTWDLPIYLFILIGAVVIRLLREREQIAFRQLLTPILMGAGMVAAYLPWYLSFTSQAGGILPNALFPTRFHQYLVMFGPFVILIGWYLVDSAWRERSRLNWSLAVLLAGLLLIFLIALLAWATSVALLFFGQARDFLLASVGVSTDGLSDATMREMLPSAIQKVLIYRLAHPLTPLFLIAVITVTLALLFRRKDVADSKNHSGISFGKLQLSDSFVFLLILTGAGLTLVPEFVYLHDVFAQRLNTVFKFYYAAWLLFSIASAYAIHVLITRYGILLRQTLVLVVIVLTGMGLAYPAFAIPAKMGSVPRREGAPPPTLNGIDFIRIQHAGDYKAILWLQQNAHPGEVVLEAVGGSYSYYGRVSAATGLPTIIGWPGHEQQWRGKFYNKMAGGRETIVREIYNTNNINNARQLLAQFNVTYVFVGSLERDPSFASQAGIQKFERFLRPIFQDNDITIYRVDQPTDKGHP